MHKKVERPINTTSIDLYSRNLVELKLRYIFDIIDFSKPFCGCDLIGLAIFDAMTRSKRSSQRDGGITIEKKTLGTQVEKIRGGKRREEKPLDVLGCWACQACRTSSLGSLFREN